jgi:hypothetical protein
MPNRGKDPKNAAPPAEPLARIFGEPVWEGARPLDFEALNALRKTVRVSYRFAAKM